MTPKPNTQDELELVPTNHTRSSAPVAGRAEVHLGLGGTRIPDITPQPNTQDELELVPTNHTRSSAPVAGRAEANPARDATISGEKRLG